MASYVYRTVDLKTNLVLEDLDLKNVQFTLKLSSVGSLEGELFVPETRRGLLIDAATYPGKTGLYVLRDNVPVWGGIIWKRQWSEKDAKFRLSCGTWESYAYHLLQPFNKSYTNTDQLTIGRLLISDAGVQTQTGIEAPAVATSGRLRQRNMFTYDYKTTGLELEQLAGLENGFDYKVENYIKSDGSFGRRYVFGYPRLGRTASLDPSTNSLTFDYPGNLAPFEKIEDSESGATRLWALGAGEGTLMLVASQGVSGSTLTWPLLDATVSYKDVSVLATLQAHANEDIKNLTPPIDSWVFQLAPDSDVRLNDINIGDSAVFRLTSRRWPEEVQMVRRIVEIKVQPGDPGTMETVNIGLSEERT